MMKLRATLALMLLLAVRAPAMSQTSSCKAGVRAAPVGFWSWAPSPNLPGQRSSSNIKEHSFGLLDCYDCERNSTVMVKFKSINVSHENVGPSACDVAQVKTTYLAAAIQSRRSPQPEPIVLDDEGEEPVEDDTPVVIRKP
jgi:hypothetical protein